VSNTTLHFSVSDDGTGYDARHTPMGSGLRNMADRLAALGGRLEIRSAPSQGTTITGRLPIPVPGGNNQPTAVADTAHATESPAGSPREHALPSRQKLIPRRDATDN